MATITFQNLFRIYKKLSGHDRHGRHRGEEFHETYKLGVVVIPTNKPIVREDNEDLVYKTEREKFTAVVAELLEYHERGPARARRDDERREERRHRATC
jgi:preprotein translocase subunit SecA